MDKFWVVTGFQIQFSPATRFELERAAIEDFGATGIEEFSLTEAEVDHLLGERAYSGGDIPESVLDEVEAKVSEHPSTLRFFFEAEEPSKKFQAYCQKQFLGEIFLEELSSKDWNAEWKKHYSPIKVNKVLEIVPSWQTEHVSDCQFQLKIYPGMGFGTGSHETTWLCLKFLTEINQLKGTNVLDFGSGSGILGLAALKLKPTFNVDFYDIDPEANRNCFHNAELNHLQDLNFRLLLPQVRNMLLPSYDLIFANILQNILIEESHFLTQRLAPHGKLILSGLLKHQCQSVIDAYEKLGMKLFKHEIKGDWAALWLEKVQG
jgi:ribosomal protein L11 methyltransferase